VFATTVEGEAIKYTDIDNHLKIELGSAKKLLPQVFSKNTAYKVTAAGGNVFKFETNFVSSYVV